MTDMATGSIIVVLGTKGSGVSSEIISLYKGMADRGCYTILATAIAMDRPAIPSALFGNVPAMSLRGDAQAIYRLLEEKEGRLRDWIVIDGAEHFSDHEQAYAVLSEVRARGAHLLIGGLEDAPLVKRLAADARAIEPSNVKEVKLLCLEHGRFHGACATTHPRP